METIRNDFEWIDLAGPVLAEALPGLGWLVWPALLCIGQFSPPGNSHWQWNTKTSKAKL